MLVPKFGISTPPVVCVQIQTRGPGGDITEEYWVACSPGDSAGVETQLMDIEPSKLRPLPVTMVGVVDAPPPHVLQSSLPLPNPEMKGRWLVVYVTLPPLSLERGP